MADSDNYRGPCRGGPNDGMIAVKRETEFPVLGPMIKPGPGFRIDKAEVVAVELGRYKWAEGVWFWSPAR